MGKSPHLHTPLLTTSGVMSAASVLPAKVRLGTVAHIDALFRAAAQLGSDAAWEYRTTSASMQVPSLLL